MNIQEAIEAFLRYLKSDCYLDAPPNEAVEIALDALRSYKQAENEEDEE